MKKQKRKWYKMCVSWLLVMLIAISFTACKNDNTSTSTENKSKKIPFKIEDIDWSVDEEIIEGERRLVFGYTNNSKFTITSFGIDFKQKSGITSEELSIFDTYKEKYELEETDIQELFMSSINERLTKSGEASKKSRLYFNNSAVFVQTMSEYQLMQPDIATIKYLETDNKVYTFYYDFASKKYNMDSGNAENLSDDWIDNEYTKLIPKPEFDEFKISSIGDTYFRIESDEATKEQANAYAEQCKTMGWTINSDMDNSKDSFHYDAENTSGYKLSVSFYFNSFSNDSMTYIDIDKPENATEVEQTSYSNTITSADTESWKQFLKDYEAWTDKYIEFMKKYKENPSDLGLISDYGKFIAETTEWASKAEEYGDELENENVSYEIITEYFDTLSGITQKIVEVVY